MTKPVRIQRKRTKGFSMQKASPNGLPVVYVGRPTKWGNPYSIKSNGAITAFCDYQYELERTRQGFPTSMSKYMNYDDIKAELKGKNLACYCPWYQPCHADILLKIANG